ncbi:MAG TPA: AraC family transcriptional regulator [Xanthobacteraceae bacterium]|jgi:AraC-like DNA-binding protein|nr:AraC family transcriptional regulator [Xanthobacteraceae bacterium]
MGTASHLLASGPGWRVSDVVCTAGPRDRPFEERHDAMCIAAVTQGTFQYRSAQGVAVLAPGALLLGNAGRSFECGHEHGTGDRCLAFHFAPDHLEAILAGVPGARRAAFAVPRLPPLQPLVSLIAAAEIARDERDGAELEELALRLAGAVAVLAGDAQGSRVPSRRDERRVTQALRRIEARFCERLTLTDLARDAATSPYHFLRTFRQVVGMTPHQFVLRTRLGHAAVRLRGSTESITAIALDVGFDDLSTFNRRFRRLTGMSPSAYRARRGAAGSESQPCRQLLDRH